MEDPKIPVNEERRSANFEIAGQTGVANIFMSASKSHSPEISFDETIEMVYKNVIKGQEGLHPKKPRQYHYHKIVSSTYPRIAVGFFRYKDSIHDNSFDKNDLQILALLSPHIFLLYRTIMNDVLRSPTLQYFTVFTNICAEIAKEHDLSDSQYKLIPEILFGLTNEEIAKKHFVSVAAIKKHIKHIFKKTGSKNRIDFISKFFTSPERIDLSS
ncbi:MAG: LuxR C-terminal-related transcriptional regulator [Candidatus Kapaibacterium sp.]